MNMRKTRIAVFSIVLLAIGLIGGLMVSMMMTTGRASSADFNGELTQYLAALDQRIAQLPPLDQSFTLVAKRVTPAVVTISSERIVRQPQSRMQIPEEFRRFFGDDDFFFRGQPRPQLQQGLGSGVIVDAGGIILTNNHVVEQADDIQVTLADRRTLKATVVGSDPLSDIAVLRIDEKNLPFVPLGNSDDIEVGEWVLAIGNPFSADLAHTVTAGIVSAKGRESVGVGTTFQDFIQTDAAINPGNSGGALVNMRGELIGINSAIATRTGTYSGIGFAVPANLARTIMNNLLEHGRVVRGYLGLYPQDIDLNLSRALGMEKPTGAIVAQVLEKSPAAKAGVRDGDIILAINGSPVNSAQDLINKIGLSRPGSEVTLSIMREDARRDVTVVLGEREEDADARIAQPGNQSNGENQADKLGMRLAPLGSTRIPQVEQLFQNEKGLFVLDVQPGSPADKAGIAQGVLITAINGKPVATLAEFQTAIAAIPPGQYARVQGRISDGQGTVIGRYFAIEIPKP